MRNMHFFLPKQYHFLSSKSAVDRGYYQQKVKAQVVE